jgi:uncharacterized membrane protein YfcA
MMEFFVAFLYQNVWAILAVIVAALFTGMSKAGITPIALLAIPILAQTFGPRNSTGLLLLIYIAGDIFAVKAYRQHADWAQILKLLPAVLTGIILAIIIGNRINDQQFKMTIAVLVLLCLVFLILLELRGSDLEVPHGKWFVIFFGLLSGFATMIGNAGGPIFTIYLLAISMKKNSYLGTLAWLFMIVNLTKLPLQIFAWRNITWDMVLMTLAALPVVFGGVKLGIWIIKHLEEKIFRYVVIGMTMIAAVRMFF